MTFEALLDENTIWNNNNLSFSNEEILRILSDKKHPEYHLINNYKREELKSFLQENTDKLNTIIQEQDLAKRTELLCNLPGYQDHVISNKKFIDLILRACNKELDIARNDNDKKINLEILQSIINYDTDAVIPHSIAWFTYMTNSITDKMFTIEKIGSINQLIEYIDQIINKKKTKITL
jgi:hypothetical protein